MFSIQSNNWRQIKRFLHNVHVLYISVPDVDFIPKSMARRKKMRENENTSFPKPPGPRKGKKVSNQMNTVSGK